MIKYFFNNKNEKKFMLIFEKVKQILFKNLIKAIKLNIKNLKIKNLASFYKIKNIARLNQYWAFKKRYF